MNFQGGGGVGRLPHMDPHMNEIFCMAMSVP